MNPLINRLMAEADSQGGDTENLLFEAVREIDRLRDELGSIAANSCCDGCQEAGRWAKAALAKNV